MKGGPLDARRGVASTWRVSAPQNTAAPPAEAVAEGRELPPADGGQQIAHPIIVAHFLVLIVRRRFARLSG